MNESHIIHLILQKHRIILIEINYPIVIDILQIKPFLILPCITLITLLYNSHEKYLQNWLSCFSDIQNRNIPKMIISITLFDAFIAHLKSFKTLSFNLIIMIQHFIISGCYCVIWVIAEFAIVQQNLGNHFDKFENVIGKSNFKVNDLHSVLAHRNISINNQWDIFF